VIDAGKNNEAAPQGGLFFALIVASRLHVRQALPLSPF